MTTASFDPASGVLTVTGTSSAEAITISRDATGTILVNGGSVSVTGGTPSIANTALIALDGLLGNDTVILDEASGALPRANLVAGSGHDAATGGSGNDTIWGDSGNDILLGKGGFDILFGGDGNDTLTGGDSDDQLFGGAGDDRAIWNPGDDTDLFEGGDGFDTAEVNGGNGAEVFSVTANGARVRFDRTDPAPFSIDIGTSETLVIKANGGDDQVSTAGNLAALIALTIDGGIGNDTLLGGNGGDLLLGGDGNDFVDGNQGSDTARLGAGDDRFGWDPGDGSDSVDGEAGADTLDFNGSAANENIAIAADGRRVSLTRDIGAITLSLTDVETLGIHTLAGSDTIRVGTISATPVARVAIDLAAAGGTAGDGASDQVIVDGTTRNDAISILGGASTLGVAGLSAQVDIAFSETGDALTVNAGGGNDTISTTGNVAALITLIIDAGTGNDTVQGGNGNDIILGGDGNDLVAGRQGGDIALLGDGNDVFTWNPGDGNDTVEGQDGTDTLDFFGSAASEIVGIVANGGRALMTRNIGNIVMDMNDVERVIHHALGGTDNVTIGDLTGTDIARMTVDLAGTVGGSAGDGAADTVFVNGVASDDAISLRGSNGTTVVEGLATLVTVTHAEQANDRIAVLGAAGADALNAASLAATAILVTLDGGSGDDTLTGGAGGDILLGGGDNDIVAGGRGDDQMFGGTGNDRLVSNLGDGTDLMEGEDGTDIAEVNGGGGAETFTVTANGTRVRFDRIDAAPFALDIGTVEHLVVNAGAGNDNISAIGNLAALIALTIDGGAGNDMISGGNGADVILGGDGNDAIAGRQGNDVAFLGDGNDVFAWNPGDGNDTVEGQAGTDTLDFFGSAANENIAIGANGGRVLMTRDIGAIVMDMNDVERIIHHALGGTDNIAVNDLAGTDIAQVTVDLAGVIGGTAGDAVLDTVAVGATGGDDAVSVRGNNGTAIVEGLTALVTVTHADATDRLTVNGFGGADVLDATSLTASALALVLDGGSGNDTLTGGAGGDTLLGGDGDDAVTGRRGNDIALLGLGDDRFRWALGDGSDTVEGQDGADTVELHGSSADQAFRISANGTRVAALDQNTGAALDIEGVEAVAIIALGGQDAITVDNLAGTDLPTVTVDLAGTAGGTAGDGETDQVTVNGTGGDDLFELGMQDGALAVQGLGTAVAITHAETGDLIFIRGEAGNDSLFSAATGGGQLILDGGADNDAITGGRGDDIIIGGAGGDTLDGGAGVDTLDYSLSPDAVAVDLRLNTAAGGDATGDTIANFENMLGSDFADTIGGSAGVNRLDGGRGNDAISALGGNDAVDGGIGNDLLAGGAGQDTLTGGLGADRFIYLAGADSTVAAADLIGDFHRSHRDKIDLTAIDANTALSGDQAFTFIDTAGFGGNRGELRIVYGTGVSTVFGDITGDGTADFAIRLAGIDAAHALAASDFLL